MSQQQIFHPLTKDNLKLFVQRYNSESDDWTQLLRDLKNSRKTGAMDDYLINRVIKEREVKFEFLDCAEKQINKWLDFGNPNKVQSLEIQTLCGKLKKTRKIFCEVGFLSLPWIIGRLVNNKII